MGPGRGTHAIFEGAVESTFMHVPYTCMYEILICYTGEGITPPGQTYDLPAQGSVEQAFSNEISLQAKDK